MLRTSIAGICLAGTLAACAQQETTIRRQSTLVLVPALVLSSRENLSQQLTAQDFVVTDNGVEQQARLEMRSTQPMAMLVVMQTGGGAPRQFAYYRGLETMLEYAAGSAETWFGLLTFDSKPEGALRFSRDIKKLHAAIEKPEAGDGGAAILDALSAGADWLAEFPAGTRRVMLLLSQPQDRGSKIHVDDLLRKLSETSAEVYSLTFSPEKTWVKDQFTGPRKANPPYKLSPMGPAVMGTFNLDQPLRMAFRAMQENAAEEVASLSGGEYLRFDDKAELEKQMAVLANHLPNRYLLSFVPSVNTPGLHALTVRVKNHPELTVHTRSGYWVDEQK